MCLLKCFKDFRPNVLLPVSCEYQGTMHWSPTLTNVKCKDVCRPIIVKCPTKVIAIADSRSIRTTVTWDPITVVDNDNIGSMNSSTGNVSSGRFPVGNSTVYYYVSDYSGNTEHCTFGVTVEKLTCLETVIKNICDRSINSCYDVFRRLVCSVNCNDDGLVELHCPSQGLPNEMWDVMRMKTVSCSGYLVKMRSRNSYILLPAKGEPHTTLILSLSFRVMTTQGNSILLIRGEKEFTTERILNISLSFYDPQRKNFNLHITFQNKTLDITENVVGVWNNLRMLFRGNGTSWILNINQTVGSKFRSYDMNGPSSLRDEFYAVFGKYFTAEFPKDQEGLELCGFQIINKVSGNIMNSLWPEEIENFKDVHFSTPTFNVLRINDGDRTCRASRNCSSPECKCSSGFSGEQCEIPPSICVSGLCKNQGQCNDIGNNSFVCICRKGFEGLFCEKETKKVCPEFYHQEETVITCNKDYTDEICKVACKSGRVRVDEFRQHSTYMCGASTSHKWVLLTSKHPITDNQAPICAQTDWIIPRSLKSDITVKFKNIKCDQIQNRPCEDWCNIKIDVKDCQNQNNTVIRTYSLKINLTEGMNGADGKLGVEDFYEKGTVSNALLSLVRSYYGMESKLLELRKVVVTSLDQDRRKRSSDSLQQNLVEVHGIIVYITAETICGEGSFNHFGNCAYCPAGSYQVGDRCQWCAPGYYQSFVGQTNCILCPQGHISTVGSNTIQQCYVPGAQSNEEEEGLNEEEGLSTVETIFSIIGSVITAIGFVGAVIKCIRNQHYLEKIRSWCSKQLERMSLS
ncbi:uncharacterized protein LOC134230323 isoform X2 [Saccostrea cucullata]